MSATNTRIAHNAIVDYNRKILDEIEKRCDGYCSQILVGAIDARLNHPRAHNFTGNLITSIVVCLYRNKQPVRAYFAGHTIDGPIAVKMTFPKTYHWKKDYDGVESHYKPEIATIQDYGERDAREFFKSYRPTGKSLFDIVVAYPVEYADYIQQLRETTGILQAYDYADKIAVTYLAA